MPTKETALMQSQRDSRLRVGMARLLHRLRGYVSVYPVDEDAKMPEHDVVWVAHVGLDGPEQTILEAIKTMPELWAPAIPPECCIVHRETLKKYVGADAAEYMAGYGANAVENLAARLRHEADLRETRKT